MFTGLIKELGEVVRISKKADLYELAVRSKGIYKTASTGDSVAVNGVCLTVTRKVKDGLLFDVMAQTVRNTTMSGLASGDQVNLEDSLRTGEPVGGHFVLGHVDCVGKVTKIIKTGKDASIEIEFPEGFDGLVVSKGSIAIDGVSLTVGDIEDKRVRLYVIPHTLKATTLGSRAASDRVNIEFDILGKYAAGQKGPGSGGNVTEEFLKEKGFI